MRCRTGYLWNLRITLLLLCVDVIMTALGTTWHSEETSQEDLLNIVWVALHGSVGMSHFVMVFVSVTGTVKYKGGLFGELLDMILKPLLINVLHVGIMPMPWVTRRYILKKAARQLYWDSMLYVIVAGVDFAALFAVVYSTFYMHCKLSESSNYDISHAFSLAHKPSLPYLMGLTWRRGTERQRRAP
eukprot:TRINITY_DN5610_c2_g1_i1.p1 TRINITY_DN5610_c2_g1~~TRINITY_DN5610_c2_g1_i1.p1  ORF type:complete len:187 (+),score=52.16 TRINITY_DN5610_c2_g1_i1:93-653(+)